MVTETYLPSDRCASSGSFYRCNNSDRSANKDNNCFITNQMCASKTVFGNNKKLARGSILTGLVRNVSKTAPDTLLIPPALGDKYVATT